MQRVTAEPLDGTVKIVGSDGCNWTNVFFWVEVDVETLTTDRLSVALCQQCVDVEGFLQVQYWVWNTFDTVRINTRLERSNLSD